MNLVVLQSDMVLINGIPLLNSDLFSPSSSLSSHELLEISDGVVIVALDADLLPKTIVQHNLDHLDW